MLVQCTNIEINTNKMCKDSVAVSTSSSILSIFLPHILSFVTNVYSGQYVKRHDDCCNEVPPVHHLHTFGCTLLTKWQKKTKETKIVQKLLETSAILLFISLSSIYFNKYELNTIRLWIHILCTSCLGLYCRKQKSRKKKVANFVNVNFALCSPFFSFWQSLCHSNRLLKIAKN